MGTEFPFDRFLKGSKKKKKSKTLLKKHDEFQASLFPEGNIFEQLEGGERQNNPISIEEELGETEETKANTSTNANKDHQKASSDRVAAVRDAKFTLELRPDHDDRRSEVESRYIDHMRPSSRGILIDPNKRFQNFIIGPSNNMACATAKAVAGNPGKNGKYPSLYIYSHSGLGKTHLLHAVANEIKELYPELVLCLITARDFMNEMVNAIQNNNINEFRKKYSEKIDVLMIDDIHELKDKHGTQNEFFHIFNELHNKGKQLIFTSDKAPKEIDGIAERIKTRLQWGLVIDIQRPDLETRLAILKKKAASLDLYLSDDVLGLIASSIKSSIRELEGSLIKLSAFSEVMKVEIDTQIVKDLLMLADGEGPKEITIDLVVKQLSNYFSTSIADLKSKSRNKEIARPRHIAMYLSRKLAGVTHQEIGRFFGGRDHSSVLHAINKVAEQLKTDTNLERELFEIESLII